MPKDEKIWCRVRYRDIEEASGLLRRQHRDRGLIHTDMSIKDVFSYLIRFAPFREWVRAELAGWEAENARARAREADIATAEAEVATAAANDAIREANNHSRTLLRELGDRPPMDGPGPSEVHPDSHGDTAGGDGSAPRILP